MSDLDTVFALAEAWDDWSQDPKFPFEPGCCVNGSRVAMEVLRTFDVRAKPMSVQFVLFNTFGWAAYEAGVPTREWPPQAWSVGVGPDMRPPSAPDRWRGHLMLEGKDWTLDVSARQFNRPGRINVETPLVMPVTLPSDGWSISHGRNGNVLMIARFPANNTWREASGWKRPHVAERYELTRRVQRVLEKEHPMTIETETPVTAPAKRMTLRGKVEVLTAEVAELKRQRAIVGTLLRDEAYEREWRSDYNYFVDNVNRACGDAWLVPLDCDEEEVMGLDNIPHTYPCRTAGTAVLIPREDGESSIGCDATIEAGGCPWKIASDQRGHPVYGMMGTYCWYRGKVASYMLSELEGAGHYLPEAVAEGFYGDGEADPNLSPEYCLALGTWMEDHGEAFAALHRGDEDGGRDAIDTYRYAAWWLGFVAEHADGADAWW